MARSFPLGAGEIGSLGGYAGIAFSVAYEVSKNWQTSLLVALAAFLATALFVVNVKVWRRRATQFRLVKKVPEEGLAFHYLKRAQREIRVTHFSDGIPADASIHLMLSKLKQGVSITRIVGIRGSAAPERYTWLEAFAGRPGYREERLTGPCLPPCDFIVIDGQTVVFYLPAAPNSNEFERALVFSNRSVAEGFNAAFDRLLHHRDRIDARYAPAPVPA